jgi:hypothetical protein
MTADPENARLRTLLRRLHSMLAARDPVVFSQELGFIEAELQGQNGAVGFTAETSGNCGPNTPWDRLCGEPSCGYCGLRRTPDLPAFIRRDVERAIEDALHPRGMSTHDGKARIGVDRLQYLMRMIDGTQDETPAHRKWPGEPPHCPSCACGAPETPCSDPGWEWRNGSMYCKGCGVEVHELLRRSAEKASAPTTCDTKCFGWPRCECGRRMP